MSHRSIMRRKERCATSVRWVLAAGSARRSWSVPHCDVPDFPLIGTVDGRQIRPDMSNTSLNGATNPAAPGTASVTPAPHDAHNKRPLRAMNGRFGTPRSRGADVVREVASMSAPGGRTPLAHQVERVSIDHTEKAAHSFHPTRQYMAPMPTAARDEARYVRSQRPLINWLRPTRHRRSWTRFSRFRRPRASTLAFSCSPRWAVAPPLQLIAFNVRDRHRLGKHGGECALECCRCQRGRATGCSRRS